ncbi:MAG: DUF2029 domain-containing protein [Proteobacteria bacterium]|nr:DUF2029 domain-containing protein [Pseudomonadota bacterium]
MPAPSPMDAAPNAPPTAKPRRRRAGILAIESSPAVRALVLAVAMIAGALISLSRGQDTNFDQLNYHYYVSYAFETGALDRDVAPAQVLHSYLSPYVYLPFYQFVRSLPPRGVGLAMGALHGINVWLVIVLSGIAARGLPARARLQLVAAATVISFAGPMVISEAGTSFADILISIPTLGGLALLLGAEARPGGSAGAALARVATGAALLGAATSLKLTAAPFALAYGAAALTGWRAWRHRAAALAAAGAGGAAGFALIGGVWYFDLWRSFGNPIFPYFNTVFRAPDYPSGSAVFDARFLPTSLFEAAAYPFRWVRTQHTTAELNFRDIRFALMLALGALALIARLARGTARPVAVSPVRTAGTRLMVFLAVAFVLWMYEWSIQRYLVSLELLTGPAMLILLRWWGPFPRRSRMLEAAAIALAVLCAISVRPPDWGHLGWRDRWFAFNPPPVSTPHPVYFMASEPTSFVVPELPAGAIAVGVIASEPVPDWGDTVFRRRVASILADPANGPYWSVSSGEPVPEVRRILGLYGLRVADPCIAEKRGRPFPLTWCRLERAPPPG